MASLFDAIEQDDEVMLKQMLKDGYSIKVKNAQGQQPLVFALSLKRTNCLKLLLNYNADPNDKKFDAFKFSVNNRNPESMKILLDYDAYTDGNKKA